MEGPEPLDEVFDKEEFEEHLTNIIRREIDAQMLEHIEGLEILT